MLRTGDAHVSKQHQHHIATIKKITLKNMPLRAGAPVIQDKHRAY